MKLTQTTPKYKIIYPSDSQDALIKICQGKFKNVVYKYLVVSPKLVDDQFILSFNYELIEGKIKNEKQFKHILGDILMELIDDGHTSQQINT